ncbi:MAG TPA: RebB family R body protein [Rhizomicrobium sp.]|jgi:hypothetical protein
MADVTQVNGQITDAVTQENVAVIGGSPAQVMMSLSQAASQAFALMMQNATTAQQNGAMCAQAAANQGVIAINSTGSMAAAAAGVKLGQSDVPDTLLALLTALRAGSAPLPA